MVRYQLLEGRMEPEWQGDWVRYTEAMESIAKIEKQCLKQLDKVNSYLQEEVVRLSDANNKLLQEIYYGEK